MENTSQVAPSRADAPSSWARRKVIVTGAGGFIGSHLCDALVRQGAEVTALIRYSSRSARDWGNLEFLEAETRASLHVIAGNIEDGPFVERAVQGQELVFHLAALIAIPYSYAAPLSYVRTNVEGTANVLEGARKAAARVVHTSTSETYGTARRTPIDEGHPLQAQSPYAASKIGADKLAEAFHLSFGVPVSTIRPFNTFGPRQSARAVIPTIISQALDQPVVRLGALTPVRDLTFVRDTVEGFLRIAQCDRAIGQTINIGRGEGVSIGDLAQRIMRLTGRQKPVVEEVDRVRPAESEVQVLVCDSRRAREVLGWTPRHSLDEGLLETIEFVRGHKHLFRAETYNL